MKDKIIIFLKSEGIISIQQVRTLLGLSRKYILPLFNQLDKEGISVEQRDMRIIAQRGDEREQKRMA